MEIRKFDDSSANVIDTKIQVEPDPSNQKETHTTAKTFGFSERFKSVKNDRGRFCNHIALQKELERFADSATRGTTSMHTLSWRQMDHLEKVLSLIDQTNYEICAVELLFSDFDFDASAIPEEKKLAVLIGLSEQLIELQKLTSELAQHRIDDVGLVVKSIASKSAKTAPNSSSEAEPNIIQSHLFIEHVLEKCAEIIDELPRLCDAMDRPKVFNHHIFDHYTHIDENVELGNDAEKMLEHAALAQTMYAGKLRENLAQCDSHFKSPFSKTWKEMSIPDILMQKINSAFPNLTLLDDGRMCDFQSGLAVQIFCNEDKKRIALAFGGTTSGMQKGCVLTRIFGNFGMLLQQWLTNLQALSIVSDAVPRSYHQASELTKLVLNYFKKDPEKKYWSVLNTGHSKGAGEAAYAAAANGVYATCFGTPELSGALLNEIGPLRLAISTKKIRHYFVKGDVVPKVSGYLSPVVSQQFAHIGTGFWMEPSEVVGQGILKFFWCHDLFFESVITEAGRQNTLKTSNQNCTKESENCSQKNESTLPKQVDKIQKKSLFDILNDSTDMSPYHPFQ